MRSSIAFLIAMLMFAVPCVHGQLSIQTIDVAGDSISKGFNAGNAFPCSNGDQETFNWLTSDTHGTTFCGAGAEGVFSVVERIECGTGGNIIAANPNHAASGATLLGNLITQATNVRTYLLAHASPRLAVVFLGHNDNCSGTVTKVNASCSSVDLDPTNYCKTRPDAFERELRKGLDVLMSTGDTRIGVVSPVRVSQLCNFGTKSNCQLGGSCQFVWGVVSICAPLTRDCSSTRVVDSYQTLKTYRDILRTVTAEYAAIPDFGSSPLVFVGGQTVGGGVKAAGTTFVQVDAPWNYRFKSSEISCCDCFHPSGLGQDTLARMLKDGFVCSRNTPCCLDTGDPLADGKCTFSPRRRIVYNGLLSSGKNLIELPGIDAPYDRGR
jgi:hypothetical protein